MYRRDRMHLGYPVDLNCTGTSIDDVNWTDIPGQSHTNYANPGNNDGIIRLFHLVTARYIRLYATKLSHEGLAYHFQLNENLCCQI